MLSKNLMWKIISPYRNHQLRQVENCILILYLLYVTTSRFYFVASARVAPIVKLICVPVFTITYLLRGPDGLYTMRFSGGRSQEFIFIRNSNICL